MRALTPTERGYLTDPEGHACFVYAEVTNADGTWINLSDVVVGARNADFVTTFSFSDNQDANTHSITITLFRDVGSGVYSLSPFRSDSPLNVDDSSSFAPLADLHRQWRLWGCILPLGTFPSSPSDYREWWRGNVDRIDVAGEESPAVVTLQGRGPEADLIDARIIDVPKTYAGAALATWTQNALDDQFGSGTIPLTVDGSAPSFFVNDRDLAADGDMGFFDLISETAALPGALLRYKYDASDALSFTLFAPNRTPSTPDWSTDGDEYEKLDVGIGLDAVRNYIIVRYMDDVAGLQTVTSPVTPVSASITRYGLRVMVIDLAASTTITDQTAAGNLADAVRSDLEFPIIEHQLTGHGLWFAELGDYVQLVANGVHYDQDQFGGVTSIQHTFENGELKSVLGFRGNPSGRYRTWLDYGPGAPRVPTPPTIVWVSATYFETVFLLTRVAKVAYAAEANAWTRSVLFELSLTADFAVVLDSAAYDIAAGGGTAGGTFDIADADRGNVFWVRATPYSGPLSGGVPTGTAGVPAIDSTGVLFQAPTQPEFDTLQSDVTTLTSDLATETADRIAGDAATLASAQSYTDAKVAGLSWKQAVRVATTAAGTLSSSFENGDTVDGVTLATGDRILIKNQSTASENGIYTVNASGAPTRATDADTGSELVNATCYVSEGTTNADTQWTCTTNAPITLGSTSLAFAQLATGGGTIAWRTSLSRTMGSSVNDTVEIGTFTWSGPASHQGALRVTIASDKSGNSSSRVYLLSLAWLTSGGATSMAVPLGEMYEGANTDFADLLIVRSNSSSDALTTLKLRNNVGTAFTVYVTLEVAGTDTPSFAASSATGTSSVTTVYSGSQIPFRAVAGLGTAAALASDTDTSLIANSDLKIATQKAIKAYVDAAILSVGGGSSSGIGLTPDTQPASPNAADDEFEAGSLDTGGTRRSGATAWAWQNQGTATAAHSRGAVTLLAAPGGGGTMNARYILQALPAGDWTYEALLYLDMGAAATWGFAGFALRESSTNKANIVGVGDDSGYKAQIRRLTSDTSWTANPYNSLSDPILQVRRFYARVARSGSTLTWGLSLSGVYYRTIYTVAQTTEFTTAPNQIGLMASAPTAAGAEVANVCYWFRRTA